MADHIALLQKQIDKKRAEVAELRAKLSEADSFLSGMEDALRVVTKATGNPTPSTAERLPRKGSEVARCMEQIEFAGEALHVDKLLTGLGKELTKNNRVSLAGSLAGYVRKELWFTRPAPNTFGLIAMPVVTEDSPGGATLLTQ